MPNVPDYPQWLARYGNANGTTRPVISNEQILAENPGMTQELLDLYSTRMRGDYAAQHPEIQGFAPGVFDLPSMTSWNTVQQQGFNPQQLIYGNVVQPPYATPNTSTTPVIPPVQPGNIGQRAAPFDPNPGRATGSTISPGRIGGTGYTLSDVLNRNRLKTYPEFGPGIRSGTMLDNVLRMRQSGY